MIAWLQQSWANVIVAGAVTLTVCALLLAAIDALPFHRPAPRYRDDWDIRELTEDHHD